MRVQCIANTGASLPAGILDDLTKHAYGTLRRETAFPIVVGKIYVVYAFTVVDNYVWYYICDEHYSYFPIWKPSPLFTVVDPRLSQYWEFDYTPGGRCESMSGIIVAYPEWAQDPWYYDRLSDREETAVKVFEKYRRLIDSEAANWIQ